MRPEPSEALTRTPEADGRMAPITARAGYMMGRNVDRAWSPERAAAWEGFLELSRQLRRAAEGLLEPFGLSVSMLGVMGRLERAEARTLRQTELAEAMGLSVSRISRPFRISVTSAVCSRRQTSVCRRRARLVVQASAAIVSASG